MEYYEMGSKLMGLQVLTRNTHLMSMKVGTTG